MYVQSEPARDFAKYNHQKLHALTCTLSLSFSPFLSHSLSLSLFCLFCVSVLSVCLSVCLSVRPSVRPSVCLYIYARSPNGPTMKPAVYLPGQFRLKRV